MRFWMTPKQWEITKDYWKFHQRFTAADLVARGEFKTEKTAAACLKRMLKKGQVWPVDSGEYGMIYTVTTESRAEFNGLLKEVRDARHSVWVGSTLDMTGMNIYECHEFVEETSKMINDEIAKFDERIKQEEEEQKPPDEKV